MARSLKATTETNLCALEPSHFNTLAQKMTERGQLIQGNITKKERLLKRDWGLGGRAEADTDTTLSITSQPRNIFKGKCKTASFSSSFENITPQLLKLELTHFSHFSSTGNLGSRGKAFILRERQHGQLRVWEKEPPEETRPPLPPSKLSSRPKTSTARNDLLLMVVRSDNRRY